MVTAGPVSSIDPEFPNLRAEIVAGYRTAPAHLVVEIVDGELFTMPRPSPEHQNAAIGLSDELGPPFRRGRGGPGGWIFLPEPELHLGPKPDIVDPDLAGWRRERMPTVPEAAAITLAPDWICEVLSDLTEAHDRGRKMRVYRREKVGHYWLADPLASHAGGVPPRRRALLAPRHVGGRHSHPCGALRRSRARPRAPLGAVEAVGRIESAHRNRSKLRASVHNGAARFEAAE